MNYLIIGGNGYIGSKVTRRLLQQGHDVFCTKRETSDLSRLSDVNDDIRWIFASCEAVQSVFETNNIDCVLNLACNYGLNQMLYDNVIEANLEFPLKVLNLATAKGVKKFLTIGTGLPDDLNMYSFSKKKFSEFGNYYVNNHGISFTSLKLEMFYGADEPANRFLPSVIRKMLKGEEVLTTIGSQHRDVIAVDDAINAIEIVMGADLQGYNEIPVGTGEAPSISEIIDFIWKETGEKSIVNKGAIPMRNNEPDCVADTTLLESLSDWTPKPWKEGLTEMIKKIRGGGINTLKILAFELPDERRAVA